MRSRWQLAGLVGAVVFAGSLLLPVPEELRVSPFDRYGDAVVDGSIPYRDFAIEYPPGALPPILVPAVVPAVSYEGAFRALEALFGVLLVFSTAYLLRAARWSELAVGVGLVALLPTLLGGVVLFRFDLWPALLVSLSLVSLERKQSGMSAALLGLGAAAKVYAAALAPPLLSIVEREDGRSRVRTSAAMFVAAGLVVTLPLALLAPGGVASSLQRQIDRPLQIESVGASLLLLFDEPRVEFASGSWSLTGRGPTIVGFISTSVGLAALAGVWIVCWRYRRRLGTPEIAYAVCVALTLASSKVVSPQFLVWLAPLVALVRGRLGLAACLLFTGACVLTQLIYPVRYEELIAGDALPETLLATRNGLLVAVVLVLVLALARRLRAHREPPSTGTQIFVTQEARTPTG